MNKNCFLPADILLPKRSVDMTKWASIACDQYTSQPDYWKRAEDIASDSPSALKITLPEVYLDEADKRVGVINNEMKNYIKDGLFDLYPDSYIYIERKLSNGKVRYGIVGMIDLEEYDYNKASVSLVRATEGTVLERIPARVEIRRDAPLEIPHIMLLIDDEEDGVLGRFRKDRSSLKEIYDFDLMLDGGSVKGYLVDRCEYESISESLSYLVSEERSMSKYGFLSKSPVLFAVGDGNHSLAAAKAVYEDAKARLGDEAKKLPVRYALAEVVNLHDSSLEFEPIFRLVFGADKHELIDSFTEYTEGLNGRSDAQSILWYSEDDSGEVSAEHPECELAVGTLQTFLDKYIREHDGVSIDYIHGIDTAISLARERGAVAFIFDGMEKNELFKTVMCDGALPRKTFSMGRAEDKRYYIECRKIINEL